VTQLRCPAFGLLLRTIARAASCFSLQARAPQWLEAHGTLGVQRRAVARLKRAFSSSDQFALRVSVTNGGSTLAMTLAGRRQAGVTAAGAAELGRMLATPEVAAPGVWFPEQVVPPTAFFAALERMGFCADLQR